MRKVKVNPRVVDGEPLRVEDELGRVIPLRDGGSLKTRTLYISRLLKFGDLELVGSEAAAKPKAKPQMPSTKKTTKKEKEE